jgi:hypothetical protein
MPLRPLPNQAPFDMDRADWLLAEGSPVPVVGRSRRTVTVGRFGRRHELKRSAPERDGVVHVDALEFRVTAYPLPIDQEQTT